MIVADTDVLIDFLGGHDPAAARIAVELERGDLRTTAITRFELLSGAKTSEQQENSCVSKRGRDRPRPCRLNRA